MAIAKKCDRCGAFHDLYNFENDPKNINALIRANADFKNHYFSHDVLNLCMKCNTLFKEWLEAGHTKSLEQ